MLRFLGEPALRIGFLKPRADLVRPRIGEFARRLMERIEMTPFDHAQSATGASGRPAESPRGKPKAVNLRLVDKVKTDPSRDALLTEFGKKTLIDRYLLPGESYPGHVRARLDRVRRRSGARAAFV
jgi:hypothetical protein